MFSSGIDGLLSRARNWPSIEIYPSFTANFRFNTEMQLDSLDKSQQLNSATFTRVGSMLLCLNTFMCSINCVSE